MAEEVLVANTLTQEMIDAGARVDAALRDIQFPATGLLWWYLPEADTWRLTIASPLARTQGPRHTYERIQVALGRAVDHPLVGLENISAIKDTDPLVELLRQVVGPEATNIRLINCAIDTVSVDGAHVYWIRGASKKKRSLASISRSSGSERRPAVSGSHRTHARRAKR